MKVRKNVFGSESEKELFATLHSHWSKEFNLYPSLPFSALVIEIDRSDTLSEKEKKYLYATSVDYTLCTKQDEPLVSVEFDGMCHGFSRDGQYVPAPFRNNPLRSLKLGLKTRVCQEANYPFFVVSYDEKVPLGEDLTLTIVDGLIGQVLARRHFQPTLTKALEEDKEIIDGLPSSHQYEYIQDLITNIEVMAELDWNPIAVESAKLQHEASEKGLWISWDTEYLSEPELPLPPVPPGNLSDKEVLEAVQRRIEASKNTVRVGCRMTVKTPKGEVSETFWVRNLEGFGASPLSLAEDIATMILAKKLLSRG
ncbi:MAG: hypothetical protein HY211_02775 [Candidatus Omnitrophica bacterium]|nr:hypothetical protein [Candidatus Omnitrophota bacterium]